jgi:hypothetical protein
MVSLLLIKLQLHVLKRCFYVSKVEICSYCCIGNEPMAWGDRLGGDTKIAMGLPSWGLLGAVLAALVGFGAYMYGGLPTSSANQAGVGEYVIPTLEAAQPKQTSEGPSQTTRNSSSGTEATENTLSAEDTQPIFNDSGSIEQRTGSAIPTEIPSSAPPLPVQAAGVPTPADSCTSQFWCATPAHHIPNQGNMPTENASSSTDDNDEDSPSKKKPSKEKPSKEKPSKEKTKQNDKGKN